MTAKDAIRQTIDMSDMILDKYFDGLDDAAFLVRPVGGMNHFAWQLGHLISTERKSVEGIKPGSCPPLPEGFDAKHGKETAGSDDAGQFLTRDEYLAAWKAQRAATRAVLESLSEAELDAPGPEWLREFCPTVGQTLNMFGGIHPLMHAGQLVSVRRSLKMPIAL